MPPAAEASPILDVRGLRMYFRMSRGWVHAVDDVTFSLSKGRTLGLVGESGCGKSSVAMSLMRVLPTNGHVRGGEVLLGGEDLLKLSDESMRQVRWKRLSVIFQGAMNALNPVYRTGGQIIDALRLHEPGLGAAEGRRRVLELFDLVGLPRSRMASFPHELSGGMKQRAVIALALVCRPEVVIADEPTTALDVLIQDQVIHELKELQMKLEQAMLIISHDMSVIAETCDHVVVMYGGQVAEYGSVFEIFESPRHPYTIGLIRSFPSVKGDLRKLVNMPGDPPDLLEPAPGCRFAARCPAALPECRAEDPPLVAVGDAGHVARCHRAKEVDPDAIRF